MQASCFYRPEIPCLIFSFLLHSARLVLSVAITAIDGAAGTRFKRDFSLFAAGGTYSGIHLAVGSITGVPGTFGFSGGAAGRATLWLVGVAFLLVELLFPCGKGEGGATIGTAKGFVLKTHG